MPVDEVAREMIAGLKALQVAHESKCDERMERIETMFTDGNDSRRGLHNIIRFFLFAIIAAAVSAFIWQYQMNQMAQMERIKVLETVKGERSE